MGIFDSLDMPGGRSKADFETSLSTPEGRARATRAVFDITNRGIAGALGGPVDLAALALKPFGYDYPTPIGGSEWIGDLMAKAGMVSSERYPIPELLVSMALPFGGARAAKTIESLSAKSLPSFQNILKEGGAALTHAPSELQNFSRSSTRSSRMFDPPRKPQRPFHDDYPQLAESPRGSKIQVDIEGRPLIAKNVAGRRAVGEADEGIDSLKQAEIGKDLNLRLEAATSRELGSDLGRFKRGPDAEGNVVRRIYLDKKLSPEGAQKVYSHELGHAIDDYGFLEFGPGGSKIPVNNIKKELAQVYSDLNSWLYVPKGKIGATPKENYPSSRVESEYIAEAIRAYMADPNYMKTVAPVTAARIREYVNSNKNLNKVIQFNGAGLGMSVPLLNHEYNPEH